VAEARKTVTVVFSDVSGSTALGERLDPEALRRVMERYFNEARTAFERHGGTVEKFIGDAVMAVFGIPAAHEDDALRAVRAAQELREAMARLNVDLRRERGVVIGVRTGINTGEVVVGDPSGGQFYATGDAVNVAARLEQAASADEILLGEQTYRLVQDTVEVEAVEPLTLKGKAEPAAAYRLLDVAERAPASARRFDTPFVGRMNELARLRECLDRSVREHEPLLVTVLGPAGIGKTRLAGELVAEVGESATVLQGRCLSYGEGITFWPLQEILRGLPERPPETPDPEQAQSTEEIFWAYRKLFQELSRERPLLLVLEDIHWAEPTLLDFIEHVVEWTSDSRMLLLCLARPELLDERPGWPGERIELEPLAGEEADALLTGLGRPLEPAHRLRITETAEGNPLFLEQLLALAAEQDGDEVALPPTIQGLLVARLDRLDREERSVLEAASVIGKEFWRGALLHLSPSDSEVSVLLQRLVRRRLIRPERSSFVAEDAFRFGHILIRDATYSGIPKETRASLHERLADWLESSASPYEEIVGYHLEQAHSYRLELGPSDDETGGLALRAGLKLAAAGQRAFQRGDSVAAANLLDRAATLLPPSRPERLDALLALGSVLTPAGQPDTAQATLDEAIDAARMVGDQAREWRARLERSFWRAHVDPAASATVIEDLLREAQRATSALEQLGDEQALARAWRAQAQALYWMGERGASVTAAQRAVDFAERIGDAQERAQSTAILVASLIDGPTPAPAAIRRCEEILASADIGVQSAAHTKRKLSMLYSMRREFDEARRLIDEALETFEELGLPLPLAAALGFESATVHWAEGDLAAAEGDLRRAIDLLREMDEKAVRSTLAARLAEILIRQEKNEEEAESLLRASEEEAGEDDWVTHTEIKEARALLLSRRGDFEAAVSLAQQAVALTDETDDLEARAWQRLGLAEVLTRAGRPVEAEPLLGEAIELFEAKGHLFGAEETRRALKELREPAASERASAS
jgi:class 3 adenylate cyclase/tetratricopeptide (TPR) repeat protein